MSLFWTGITLVLEGVQKLKTKKQEQIKGRSVDFSNL